MTDVKIDVHIMTGGKGGVGKTLMTLCAAMTYLGTGRKVMLVDLNYLNTDLFSILEFMQSSKAKSHEKFKIVPIHSDQACAVSFDPRLPSRYELPEGIKDFYRQLNQILDPRLFEELEFVPEVCLVDTGLHVASLIPPEMQRPESSESKGEALANTENLSGHNLYIWFIWTLPNLIRGEEVSIIRDSVMRVPNLAIGKFNPITRLVHVFNPFAVLAPPTTIKDRFKDIVTKLADVERVARWTEPKQPVDFDFFHKSIWGRLSTLVSSAAYPEAYVLRVTDAIRYDMEGRPCNTIVVPPSIEFKGYIEDFLTHKPRTLREIEQRRFGKTYPVLNKQILRLPA